MKTFVWGAALSAGLLALAACGGEAPAATTETPAPAVEAPPVIQKISGTVIDPTLFGHFMIVPDNGDTGAVVADGSAYEMRSSAAERFPEGDGDGIVVRVQEPIAAQLGGRKVKVTVTARTAPTNGAPTVKVMYFRPGSQGGSGWQEFTLSSEFAPYTFEYVVPTTPSTSGFDNIGFWADPEGKGRGVEVSGITVETVDQP